MWAYNWWLGLISVDVPWLVRRTMWVERAPPLPPAPEVSPCTLDHGKSPCFSFGGPWLQYLYVKYITRRYQGVNPNDLIGLGIDINYGFIGITMCSFCWNETMEWCHQHWNIPRNPRTFRMDISTGKSGWTAGLISRWEWQRGWFYELVGGLVAMNFAFSH